MQLEKLLDTMDESMVVGNRIKRTAVGVTDDSGKKYYIEYPGAQAQTKEQAKSILIDELRKRFN